MTGAYATVNGIDLVALELYLPRLGVWHAHLVADAGVLDGLAEDDQVTIAAAGGELVWRGTVRRSGISRGTAFVRVVGGGGGLATMMVPKAYQGVSLRIPLQDILSAAGETLASSADAGLLAGLLARWTIVQQTAGDAVASLVRVAGDDVVWRILADGTFWLGRESWLANALEFVELRDEPSVGRLRISADVPRVAPGDSLGGRKVSYVEHHFNRDGLRTQLWLEAA